MILKWIDPPRDPIQLNPLAPPFCPQHRLGEAHVIRYDTDYEMWRYAVNENRRNSTCLFGEPTGYSELREDKWRQTYRQGFEIIRHSPTPKQRRLAKSQARTAQWRASQRFKERSDLAHQIVTDSHTLSGKKRQSTIDQHMRRLRPSTDKLMTQTT